MNHARIREIATKFSHDDPDATIAERIESAILRFAEELLTQEPSLAMQIAASNVDAEDPRRDLGPDFCQIYRAMSAQLLKEVKGE